MPGNGESAEELAEACHGWKAAHVLHGEGVDIDSVPFFGLGGGVPVTPFGPWSYDFTEDEARDLLTPCPEDAVLVSHSPPLGHADADASGRHMGSTAVYWKPSNAPTPASSSAATSTAHGASAPEPETPRSSTPAPQAWSGAFDEPDFASFSPISWSQARLDGGRIG